MADKEKEKSGDERAQDLIRNIRAKAGYTGKDVEPLSTRKKKTDEAVDPLTLLKGAVAAYKTGRAAYDAYKHPLTQDLIGAVKKKFRKKKKVEEGSRSIKRLARKHYAGHLDIDAPTLQHKMVDVASRQQARKDGSDPDDRPKNVVGALGALAKGTEDIERRPNVLRTKHQFSKSKDPKAEKEYAASTRAPHAIKAAKRAQSRSIGTYVPGRDQTGTVTALAQQRKESPTVDKDISTKAKAYRKIRANKVPPSMN
tara:strand:- start:2022 stop:2786 length:765 start_codon:yes stop_codon:yes gene_type:complete